ncbi:hypothetical protein ATANTOWER_011308 [Ataeniobius toweri]|uniref:Transmembrane protein 14C n=1 Tax=Ataeniobius toweri TaxID=208326 RepID=A0ABU7C1U1_9TELE|nr:hypothetical protein [Ataeniobius toweri]
MDWIGYGYAAAILFGGFMGYKRKGSVMSLIAGLVFGGFSAYGAYNVSNDPKNILASLASDCSRYQQVPTGISAAHILCRCRGNDALICSAMRSQVCLYVPSL